MSIHYPYMIKYSLYITEKQDKELREVADKNYTSVSEHIRKAIDNYLEVHKINSVASSPSRKKK